MLTDAGFDVELIVLDNQTFNSEVYFPRKTQELMLNGLGGNMNPFFLSFGFHSSRAHEYGRVENVPGIENYHEQVDQLLNTAWTTVGDDEKRLEAYHEAFALAAKARARAIGLFQVSTLWGLSDRVKFEPRFDEDIMGRNITFTGE
jgi:ABC-type transport system substrate-binding protein